jgi:polyisoprenoid-binding protein YceI
MKTWMKWAIAAVVVVILAVVGGPFVYINFIKEDAPPRLTLDDGSSASSTPTTAAGTAPAAPSAPSPAGTSPAAPATTASGDASAGVNGTWTITGADNVVGYRVVEVLFGQDTEGVGRTSAVTGELTIAGTQVSAASFSVDMTTVKSDEDRRDNQFDNNLMDVKQFPTATFELTAPIDLGGVPTDGTEITAKATGNLTLRGSTKPVTIDVQAKKTGDTFQVVGNTDIVFADYGIPAPNVPGITTQDHGLLEFDLHFAKG